MVMSLTFFVIFAKSKALEIFFQVIIASKIKADIYCARFCFRCFTCVHSFNSHNSSSSEVPFFYT